MYDVGCHDSLGYYIPGGGGGGGGEGSANILLGILPDAAKFQGALESN